MLPCVAGVVVRMLHQSVDFSQSNAINVEYTLPIIVASHENKPTLLGRNWLNCTKLT